MNRIGLLRSILATIVSTMCAGIAYASAPLAFIGSEDNDLYRTLTMNGIEVNRFDAVDEAIETSSLFPSCSGVIVTASRYPTTLTPLTDEQYALLSRMGARIYVEFPQYVPGYSLADSILTGHLERGVVTSTFFGPALPPMSILGINGCRYVPIKADSVLITFAKVAGFDKAQFGLEGTVSHPLLFMAGEERMVATTRLSQFCRARFGPSDSWRIVWSKIIGWLLGDDRIELKSFPVDPVPSLGSLAPIDESTRLSAIERGAKWLSKAHLFIHPSWEVSEISKYQSMNGNCNLFFGPAITADYPAGDGSRGVMEGHGSTILDDGSQLYRYFTRADVQGETAMLLAAADVAADTIRYAPTARRLLTYLFETSGFRGDERGDTASSVYGLLSWANTHPGTFYNDDNARCILGAIAAAAMMDDHSWDRYIVENILANLRTSSRQGFQGNVLLQQDIEREGWCYYNDRDLVNPHPHFESWMWACYLWLYDKTGFEPLLDKARRGIKLTMDEYPDGWLCQNGIQQERARMILPLAWLVRVNDTPLHRRWLDTVVTKLLESQVECGAIREELGNSDQDESNLLVTSNDAYGKNEAPLIAVNGDPVADMLYTCNFAFFALNEAAHATGNPRYHEAVRRLADFLVRIQVRSTLHPDIDGAWFRAFDYDRWDYWASNADNGWGAWSTLTGWIQAWIVTTETLVHRHRSYWDLTAPMDMRQALDSSRWMLR